MQTIANCIPCPFVCLFEMALPCGSIWNGIPNPSASVSQVTVFQVCITVSSAFLASLPSFYVVDYFGL